MGERRKIQRTKWIITKVIMIAGKDKGRRLEEEEIEDKEKKSE